MPALQAFGRRWRIAADDLTVPALVLAAFHLVWIALIITWFIYIHGPSHCKGAWQYDVAVGGLLGAFTLSFLLEVWMAIESMKGSLFETRQRRRIPTLLYVSCVSLLMQAAFNAYGTHLVYTAPPDCDLGGGESWNPTTVMKGLVWSSWAVIALVVIVVVATFNMFPEFNDPKSWEQQFKCISLACCCCLCVRGGSSLKGDDSKEDQSTVSRMGRIFAMMFGHVDMAPSDVAVSFALAMTLQRMQRTAAPGADGRTHAAGAGGAVALGGTGGGTVGRRGWPWPLHSWASRRQKGSGGGRPGSNPRGAPPAGSPPAKSTRRQGSLQMTLGSAAMGGDGGAGGGGATQGVPLHRSGSPQCTDPLMSSYPDNGAPGSNSSNGREPVGNSSIEGAGGTPAGTHTGGAGAEGSNSAGTERALGGEVAVEILPVPSGSEPPQRVSHEGGSPWYHEGWSQEEEQRFHESVACTSSFTPSKLTGGSLAAGALKTASAGGGGAPGSSGYGERGEVEDEVLQEAAHYCKYALAAYGWMLSVKSTPGMGWLQLCFGRSCGMVLGMCFPSHRTNPSRATQHRPGVQQAKRRRLPLRKYKGQQEVRLPVGPAVPVPVPVPAPVPVPDLRLAANLNREAILQVTEMSNSQLAFVRFEGEVSNVLPYYIGVDTASQEVILAIRGTLSLEDVVRDVLFEPVALDDWVHNTRDWHELPPEVKLAGSDSELAAHSGILEAVRATLMDIQQQEVLHSLLLSPAATCPGHRLVLIGHSLGAASAFLLGLYLRRYMPDLRCWAFSPPGGLASQAAGAAASEWCTSVVCGKECIPRLTINTFNRMRDEIVYAAARCRLPKLQVVLGLMRGKKWTEEELFYRPEDIPREAADMIHAYHQSIERDAGMQEFIQKTEDFTVPGRVVYLKQVGSRLKGRWRRSKRRMYRALWMEPRVVSEEGILLSGRMMADHMPDYLMASLKALVAARRHHHSMASVGAREGREMVDDMLTDSSDDEAGSGANGSPSGP